MDLLGILCLAMHRTWNKFYTHIDTIYVYIQYVFLCIYIYADIYSVCIYVYKFILFFNVKNFNILGCIYSATLKISLFLYTIVIMEKKWNSICVCVYIHIYIPIPICINLYHMLNLMMFKVLYFSSVILFYIYFMEV